jgi:hypothetical protein
VARPWKKKTRWPHVARSGARTYALGFYDHDGRERTKSFASASAAGRWSTLYIDAERRGVDSLRRFLLDLDAREANAALDGMTIGEVIQLYLAYNSPDVEDGLATSTFRRFRGIAKRHLLGHPGARRGRPLMPAEYAVKFASVPARRCNDPAPVRALREAMIQAQVGPSARDHTWRFLSAVLSWAARSELVPEISTNACRTANEKVSTRRKSTRVQRQRSSVRRRGEEIRSWALAAVAVELIRAEMLSRAGTARRPLLAYRDATLTSLLFGLALRPHEPYGIRWCSRESGDIFVDEIVSEDGLQGSGKTEASTKRKIKGPSLLDEDLGWWLERLAEHGHPAREIDFVIPGDLAGPRYGRVDEMTGARYTSPTQGKRWRERYWRPAVDAVAARSSLLAGLRGATPYALRRGGISMRLRHEAAQSVADQCGTSLEMLSRHYSYEIDEFIELGARSVDETWRAARARVQSGEFR